MKVRIKFSHKSDVLVPFEAKKGDIVQGEERQTHWEGWIYCTNKNGINGWVPKSYLEKVKNTQSSFKFKRSYNAFEIEVSVTESAVSCPVTVLIPFKSGVVSKDSFSISSAII